MKQVILALIWAVAIVSLSRLFHAGRTYEEAMSVAFVLTTGLWLALFGAAMFVLMLRTYAIERGRGNVTRPVRMFERILSAPRPSEQAAVAAAGRSRGAQ